MLEYYHLYADFHACAVGVSMSRVTISNGLTKLGGVEFQNAWKSSQGPVHDHPCLHMYIILDASISFISIPWAALLYPTAHHDPEQFTTSRRIHQFNCPPYRGPLSNWVVSQLGQAWNQFTVQILDITWFNSPLRETF
jgi:hypothetical protein